MRSVVKGRISNKESPGRNRDGPSIRGATPQMVPGFARVKEEKREETRAVSPE